MNKPAMKLIEKFMLMAVSSIVVTGVIPSTAVELFRKVLKKVGTTEQEVKAKLWIVEKDLKDAYYEGWEDRDSIRHAEIPEAGSCWNDSDTIKKIARIGAPVCPHCKKEMWVMSFTYAWHVGDIKKMPMWACLCEDDELEKHIRLK